MFQNKSMTLTPFLKHFFVVSPRAASLLFVAFLSLFALDVFEEYRGWALLPPLLIHLVPSFILLAAIGIAWHYDLFGALIFGGFAIWYVWMVGPDRPWSWYAAISGPALVVGALFAISWWVKKRSER